VGDLCGLNEVRDPEIAAALRQGPANARYWDAVLAWRLNRMTERIEALPAAGVTCRNEGYGV
jgi:hypothetical protein